jgi:Ca2+-binding RTX toxin-like protein
LSLHRRIARLNGGDGEDILIGGTTAYDHDLSSLDAIMAEWTRTDIDYNTRSADLLNGLLATGKVKSNGQANTLQGQAALDLYFGSLAADLFSLETGETFVSI